MKKKLKKTKKKTIFLDNMIVRPNGNKIRRAEQPVGSSGKIAECEIFAFSFSPSFTAEL